MNSSDNVLRNILKNSFVHEQEIILEDPPPHNRRPSLDFKRFTILEDPWAFYYRGGGLEVFGIQFGDDPYPPEVFEIPLDDDLYLTVISEVTLPILFANVAIYFGDLITNKLDQQIFQHTEGRRK